MQLTINKPPSPIIASPSEPKNALVVGTDAELADRVASILTHWRIERTNDNPAAYNVVAAKPFELILTGLSTSGKADVELLSRLRVLRPHTRLIILTHESTPADVVAAMREKAFSYFSTPLSWDDFAEMLRLAAESPCWDDGIEVLSATTNWIRLAVRCDHPTANRLLQFFIRLQICQNRKKAMFLQPFSKCC